MSQTQIQAQNITIKIPISQNVNMIIDVCKYYDKFNIYLCLEDEVEVHVLDPDYNVIVTFHGRMQIVGDYFIEVKDYKAGPMLISLYYTKNIKLTRKGYIHRLLEELADKDIVIEYIELRGTVTDICYQSSAATAFMIPLFHVDFSGVCSYNPNSFSFNAAFKLITRLLSNLPEQTRKQIENEIKHIYYMLEFMREHTIDENIDYALQSLRSLEKIYSIIGPVDFDSKPIESMIIVLLEIAIIHICIYHLPKLTQ